MERRKRKRRMEELTRMKWKMREGISLILCLA